MMQRKGLSYLEVLIASGIAVTGILALIAIFPVAILNLRKGQTVDVTAAIGPSVLNSLSALHIDDPEWWKFSTGGALLNVTDRANYPARPDFQGRAIHPAFQPFDALCFDPRFAASVATWDATQSDPTLFPSVPMATPLDARMRRMTLWNGAAIASKPALGTAQARLLFKCQDDLLFERPDDGTVPARQLVVSNGTDQRRDYFADFEFVVTAVPLTSFAGGAFSATGAYDVSAVVFRERTPDLSEIVTVGTDLSFIEEERLCDVAFLTPGYNGGDVTATLRAGRPASDLNLAQSSWALVSGVELVIDNSTSPATSGQRPVFQWYRVVSFSEVYGTQRDLTLDGPDWPPNTSNLRITLVSGVAGVFTKRITLQ
jgi:hypothetical protein